MEIRCGGPQAAATTRSLPRLALNTIPYIPTPTTPAQAWMQTKADASLLAGLLAALDVAALGLLWYGTGNLAAPALAALALNGVDFWHLHGEVLRAEAKVGRHGTGGSA